MAEKQKFSILKSPDGDLVLIIDAQPTEHETVMFLYDGGDMALLLLSLRGAVKVSPLDDEVRQALLEAEDIYVIEKQDGEIVRDYFAPIKRVKNVRSLIVS